MNHRAGFLALAVGAVLGLIVGLVYAWVIDPVELINASPDALRNDHRHEWVRLAALGYLVDGNLERVQARLAPLDPGDVRQALAAQIEAYAVQGRPADTMRTLSHLAEHLGVHTPAMAIYLGAGPPTPTPSPSPTMVIILPTPPPSTEPPPTPTPTATPLPSLYRVVSQTMLCDLDSPTLQVLVRVAPERPADENEEDTEPEPVPLAGVVLWLTWPAGADRAVTGLRPHIDPGYADFSLEPDVPYALSIGEPNAPVMSGFTVPRCPAEEGDEGDWGGWRVVVEKR